MQYCMSSVLGERTNLEDWVVGWYIHVGEVQSSMLKMWPGPLQTVRLGVGVGVRGLGFLRVDWLRNGVDRP